jgi:hypothetical protein
VSAISPTLAWAVGGEGAFPYADSALGRKHVVAST